MDAPPNPNVPTAPRHARAPVIVCLAAIAWSPRARAGVPPPQPGRPSDHAVAAFDFLPRLRDYPWRQSGW